MNRRTLIAQLQRNVEWVKSKREAPSRAGEPWRAESIMIGAVQAIGQCAQSIAGWLARRPERRRVLQDIRNRYTSQPGNKALRDLLELATATVGACSWKDDFWLGALPVQTEPKRLDEAQRMAAAERARRINRERADRRKQAREARFEHEATQNTPPQGKRQKHAVFS